MEPPFATDEADLEAKLMRAHETSDVDALAKLYALAADWSDQAGRTEEACYRRTQAYVYALEGGAEKLAAKLKQELMASGREE